MRRLAIAGLVLTGGLVVAGCGGGSSETSAPTSAPSASGAAGPSIGAASLTPGKPVVTVDGARVHVEGLGVGISPSFSLSGNVVMTITKCSDNGTSPFIVLRSSNTGLAATYVDQVNHLAKTSGKYDVEITPPPSCAWAVDIVPE
jgi:hypothetical protein